MSEGRYSSITIRPYQALCAVCSLGKGNSDPTDEKLKKLLDIVRKSPDVPITLRCNVGDVFSYQDPGMGDDTPEGAEFNRRRDLEVLLRLNFVPGETVTARILFHRLLDRISSVSGICSFDNVGSNAWRGCPKAENNYYERARQKGIALIIPPRNIGEMTKEKIASLKAMYEARTTGIRVRPHILICAVCQYGWGIRPPYKEDNLPELIQLMLKEPDTLITLAEAADWMMCAPCPERVPELNACANVKGSGGLTNQLRDLRTLQKLGLAYGETMRAKDLYGLIFEKIPRTYDICDLDSPRPSVWWDDYIIGSYCGARDAHNENYEKGKEMLMKELNVHNSPL